MKNPYQVLGIPQDATNSEIIRSQALAMKSRKYSAREIAEARVILSKPATRLAADVTFPVFPDLGEIEPLKAKNKPSTLSVEQLNIDKYDSL